MFIVIIDYSSAMIFFSIGKHAIMKITGNFKALVVLPAKITKNDWKTCAE